MLGLKIKIKSISNDEFIYNKRKEFSAAIVHIFNNLNLKNKKKFQNKTKKRFNLNEIEFRSALEIAITKDNQTKTNKEKLSIEIVLLYDKLEKLYQEKEQKKKENKTNSKSFNKLTREIFKINKKIKYKESSLSKSITFGGRFNLKKLNHTCNQFYNAEKELNKINQESFLKGEFSKEDIEKCRNYYLTYVSKQNADKIYKDARIQSIYITGEANQKGNRFIDFSKINEGIFIYKPNSKTKIEINTFIYRNHLKIINKLIELSNNKDISLSIRISNDYIVIMYDETILSGFCIDERTRRQEVKEIKSKNYSKEYEKQLISELYRKYNKALIENKFKNKKRNRFIGIDTNPDYIGFSIVDKQKNGEYKIIKIFCYDLTQLNDKKNHKFSNKRKHGIYHIWKDIFQTMKYYGCSHIVLEDLNLKQKDLGITEANRKINNLWYRELSTNLINKYCNKNGIDLIYVNPCYSSFIGNILHNYIDPINASVEIARRGIYKYEKGQFYPKFDVSTMLNTLLSFNKELDVSVLKDCKNWVSSYKIVRKEGLRYRANLEDCNQPPRNLQKLNHSNIDLLMFS